MNIIRRTSITILSIVFTLLTACSFNSSTSIGALAVSPSITLSPTPWWTPIIEATVSMGKTQIASPPASSRIASTPVSPRQIPTPVVWATEQMRGTLTVQAQFTRTPTPVPLPDLSNYKGTWKTYKNDKLKIGFEYPAFFETEYFAPGCMVRVDDRFIKVGAVYLAILSAEGLSLDSYVDQAIAQNPSKVAFLRKDATRLEREPRGIIVEYFSSISQRNVLTTYFKRNDEIYIFNVSLSLECSAQDIGMSPETIYYHIVESFKFIK